MRMRLQIVVLLALTLASCSDITNVSPSDTTPYDIASYVWPSVTGSFALSSGGSSNTTWQISDSAGTRVLTNGSTRILLSAGADATLRGLRTGSFFDLDPASYLSAEDSVRILTNTPHAATLVESSGILYIGADSGVFVRPPSSPSCRFAGLAGSVTALAQNAAKGIVFVGMADGSLWSGSDGAWTAFSRAGLPTGAIKALAFGIDQSLY
jgi:hypothetical protein